MSQHVRKGWKTTVGMWTLTAVISATTSLAQNKPARQKPERKPDQQSQQHGTQQGDGGVLAGPPVEPEAQTQTERERPGQQNRGKRDQMEMPFPQWMSALRGLEMSDEQHQQVRGVAEEFFQAQKEFRESHAPQMEALQKQIREARESGSKPDGEILAKMQKLESERPKPGPYMSRIWSLLNEEQQAEMKSRLDEMRQRMAERKEKRQDRRKVDGDQPMMDQPVRDGQKTGQMDQAPARKNAAGDGRERAQKRLKFLRSRQSGNHPDGQPTEEERRFKFHEQDGNAGTAKPEGSTENHDPASEP